MIRQIVVQLCDVFNYFIFHQVLPLVLASCYGQYIINPWGTTLVNSWDPRIWNAGLVAPRVIPNIALRTAPVVAPIAPIAPISIPTSSQYHAQDELGQFAFGHRGDNQVRLNDFIVEIFLILWLKIFFLG